MKLAKIKETHLKSKNCKEINASISIITERNNNKLGKISPCEIITISPSLLRIREGRNRLFGFGNTVDVADT